MTFTRLTDGQRDALKEISNIGMGHAATALSQLIGETVRLRVPQVSVTDIAQVPELLGGVNGSSSASPCRCWGMRGGTFSSFFRRRAPAS